jgi:DNA-binding PadR family transcriptional regulator
MEVKGRRRRHIGVPRGLLRHLSLQFLLKSPMSGSEIVDRIEEYTGWRPSPGSIYPLLSHMQEAELIQPYEDEDPTIKRFELTNLGRAHADEMLIHNEQMRSRHNMIRRMYWRLHVGVPEELYASLRDLHVTLEDVYTENKVDPGVSGKLIDVLDLAVATIKEIGS